MAVRTREPAPLCPRADRGVRGGAAWSRQVGLRAGAPLTPPDRPPRTEPQSGLRAHPSSSPRRPAVSRDRVVYVSGQIYPFRPRWRIWQHKVAPGMANGGAGRGWGVCSPGVSGMSVSSGGSRAGGPGGPWTWPRGWAMVRNDALGLWKHPHTRAPTDAPGSHARTRIHPSLPRLASCVRSRSRFLPESQRGQEEGARSLRGLTPRPGAGARLVQWPL